MDFPRLGIVRPNLHKKSCTNSDGSLRVLAEKCPTCPFRAGSSFHYQLKDIIDRLKAEPQKGMACHNTYPSDVPGAICRGSYDNYRTEEQKNSQIDFIDHPKSEYSVIPYP